MAIPSPESNLDSPEAVADSDVQAPGTDSVPEVPERVWPYWLGCLAAVYGLIVTVDLLGLGFQSLLGPQAELLLTLAANPWLGLLLGILATALVQSSSVVTSLLVALVATGLPLATAIPVVMGANLGTTITNTLVSLGYLGSDEEFEQGFAAATIHDCFNLMALVLFFPLELWLHPLEVGSRWLQTTGQDVILALSPAAAPSVLSPLLWPARTAMVYGVNRLSGPWDSLLLFGGSVGGLMISITALGWCLKRLLSAQIKTVVQRTLGGGSGLGILTGAGATALLQSSSMVTSLMIPLAGTGAATLEQIYPFVLGANIGTAVTALLAAATTGSGVALQLALVHLLYNALGVMVIYGLPVLRSLPLNAARRLAGASRRYRIIPVAYVTGLFFGLPFGALWLSAMTSGAAP